jgi:hypothetical protein
MELCSLIARETSKINDYLVANNLPTPSLDVDALPAIPIPDDATDIKAARLAVIEACSELQALMTGPKELLRFKVAPHHPPFPMMMLRLTKNVSVDGLR